MHCMGTETIDDLVFKLYTHIVDSYMDNGMPLLHIFMQLFALSLIV